MDKIAKYKNIIEKQASNQEFDWTAYKDPTGKLSNKLMDVVKKNNGEYSEEEYNLRNQMNAGTSSDYGFYGDYERITKIPYEFNHKNITNFMEGRPKTKFSNFNRTDNGFRAGRDSAEYILNQYDNLLKRMPSAEKEQLQRDKVLSKANKVLVKSERKYDKLSNMKPSILHPFLKARQEAASNKLEDARENRFEAQYKNKFIPLDREQIERYKNSINKSLKHDNDTYQWGLR